MAKKLFGSKNMPVFGKIRVAKEEFYDKKKRQ